MRQKLQPRGRRDERGGDDPGVGAVSSGRGQHGFVTERIGGLGQLSEVGERGRPSTVDPDRGGLVTTGLRDVGVCVADAESVHPTRETAAVPAGRQEPVKLCPHGVALRSRHQQRPPRREMLTG